MSAFRVRVMGKAEKKTAETAAVARASERSSTYDKTQRRGTEMEGRPIRVFNIHTAKDRDVRRVVVPQQSEFYEACKYFRVHGVERRLFVHPNMVYGTQQNFHRYHPDELQQQPLAYQALVGAIVDQCKTQGPGEFEEYDMFCRNIRDAALRQLRRGKKTWKSHMKKKTKVVPVPHTLGGTFRGHFTIPMCSA